MRNPNKFLHIADLHLIKNLHLKTVGEDIHHYKIKKNILRYIENIIIKENCGAVLISGEIEAEYPEEIYPFFKRWLDLKVRIFVVFGDHDTFIMRRGLKKLFQDEPYFYVIEEERMVKDPSLNFNVHGLSCEPKQEGFTEDFNRIPAKSSEKPTIFLTHPYHLSKIKMRELGYEYFATGHIHNFYIEKIDENIYLGRPGHSYSFWDGDGKAWPTGGIIGEFNERELTLRQTLFPAPQTVRFFINPFISKNGEVKFKIENCSEIKGKQLKSLMKGNWHASGYRWVYQGYIENTREVIENLAYKMLAVFKDELFVTPSDSRKMRRKYGHSRALFSAEHLLKHPEDLQEFIDRSFKAMKTTQ